MWSNLKKFFRACRSSDGRKLPHQLKDSRKKVTKIYFIDIYKLNIDYKYSLLCLLVVNWYQWYRYRMFDKVFEGDNHVIEFVCESLELKPYSFALKSRMKIAFGFCFLWSFFKAVFMDNSDYDTCYITINIRSRQIFTRNPSRGRILNAPKCI